ncbi:hypothetical protein LOAG_14953, partial [Loa loa]
MVIASTSMFDRKIWQYRKYQHLFQLREKYGSAEAEQLVAELLNIMDVKARQPTVSTMGEGSKAREHVPNWAFIVII